jgi:hypothetical protein
MRMCESASKQPAKLLRTNTSGYRGVSWHKAARKWHARIRQNGVFHYLGLFDTAQEASEAYARAAAKLRPSIDPARERNKLLDAVRELYRLHGFKALATPFLERQRFNLYARLLAAGIKQPVLLDRLGLTGEYAAWKDTHRAYRGVSKPTWSWDVAVAKARELVSQHGDLPTVEWCRRNGLASLTSAVHKAGKVWEDLRVAVGLRPSRNFCQSSNGMRWLSQPEALLSDFLHAHGIEHKRGERYPTDYEEKSGRKWARYDLHFQATDGTWIDVEVWGDSLSPMSGGRYARTRALKEKWQDNRPKFLGIPYKNCLSQKRLAEILEPFIGQGTDGITSKACMDAVESSLYASKSELLTACRARAAQMPDGIFPADSWLRKRGKHANRPGPVYNCLSVYVTRWFGGTRAVRELLGQGSASTTKWSEAKVRIEWAAFVAKTGLTPSQAKGKMRQETLPREIVNEAGRIYRVAHELGLLASLRNGRTARRVIWTPEHTRFQWRAFLLKHGRTPSECMSNIRRQTLPRVVTDEATNIYGAALRLGILAELRREDLGQQETLDGA